jgi:hypothetical protein
MNQRELSHIISKGFTGFKIQRKLFDKEQFIGWLLGDCECFTGKFHTGWHSNLDTLYDELLLLANSVVDGPKLCQWHINQQEEQPIRKLYATKVAKKQPVSIEDLTLEQLEQLLAARKKD